MTPDPTHPTGARDEPRGGDMACEDFVALVTAYLDDALPADVRADAEEHLRACDGCQTLLEQWHTIVGLAGKLTKADVDNREPLTRDRFLSSLRRHR